MCSDQSETAPSPARKTSATTLAVVLLVVLLGGCSGSSPQETESSPPRKDASVRSDVSGTRNHASEMVRPAETGQLDRSEEPRVAELREIPEFPEVPEFSRIPPTTEFQAIPRAIDPGPFDVADETPRRDESSDRLPIAPLPSDFNIAGEARALDGPPVNRLIDSSLDAFFPEALRNPVFLRRSLDLDTSRVNVHPSQPDLPLQPGPTAPNPEFDTWSSSEPMRRSEEAPEGYSERSPASLASPEPIEMVPARVVEERASIGLAVPRTPDATPPSPVPSPRPSGQASSVETSNRPVAGISAEQDNADYDTVTVFYGTDRRAVGSLVPEMPHLAWLYRAAFVGMVTLVICWWAKRLKRSRNAWSLAIIGGTITISLVAMGLSAYLQIDPEALQKRLAYGNERGVLDMGTCQVSIPKDHVSGMVERPSVWTLELAEDPAEHVVLLGVERREPEAFFDRLGQRVAQSSRREAFVFIHGYNVTFDAAARRTAQLAHDLEFDGAPIFYSWPSQGGLLQYSVDETNVVWTVPHLKAFLTEVSRKSDARSIHLIAHSMGNRALTSALNQISHEPPETRPMFHQVVLTAPDIDADVFRRDIAPAIVKTARRVTLYASSNDKALALSKQVHGYPRAGESGDNLVIVPGIDTIDVSQIDTSLIAHSYYGSNQTVLADLLDLIRAQKPPHERSFLESRQLGEFAYWVFCTQHDILGNCPAGIPTRR